MVHGVYLDTVPPTDVVWNYVATDKLTTQDGDKFRTDLTRPVDDLMRLLTSRMSLSLPCLTRFNQYGCKPSFTMQTDLAALRRRWHAKGRTGVKYHRQAVHKDLKSLTMC